MSDNMLAAVLAVAPMVLVGFVAWLDYKSKR